MDAKQRRELGSVMEESIAFGDILLALRCFSPYQGGAITPQSHRCIPSFFAFFGVKIPKNGWIAYLLPYLRCALYSSRRSKFITSNSQDGAKVVDPSDIAVIIEIVVPSASSLTWSLVPARASCYLPPTRYVVFAAQIR